MRSLDPIPDTLVDSSGNVRHGSYIGAFDKLDLHVLAGKRERFFKYKRWMWMGIATEDAFVVACVVDLGYASNAFAFVYDARETRMLVDRSAIGMRARVEENGDAVFESRKLGIELSTRSIRVRSPDLVVDAILDVASAPPITAVARVEGGRLNVTRKCTLSKTLGTLVVQGRTLSLEGGLGGYDLTHGLLARHTAWRWGFGMGRDESGTPIAFNLVQGFVGRDECALFRGDRTTGLEEGRFTFDADPMREWHVESERVDLKFRPGGVHQETKNLVVVRSRFIQAVGEWTGEIDGSKVRVLGVAEDQDVLW